VVKSSRADWPPFGFVPIGIAGGRGRCDRDDFAGAGEKKQSFERSYRWASIRYAVRLATEVFEETEVFDETALFEETELLPDPEEPNEWGGGLSPAGGVGFLLGNRSA